MGARYADQHRRPWLCPLAIQAREAGAAKQRLLAKLAEDESSASSRGGRRGGGRGRGRRRRGGFDDEDDDSAMTLEEFEAQRKAKLKPAGGMPYFTYLPACTSVPMQRVCSDGRTWMCALLRHALLAIGQVMRKHCCESLGKRQHIPIVKASKHTKQAKYKQIKQGKACSVQPHPNKQARHWRDEQALSNTQSRQAQHTLKASTAATARGLIKCMVKAALRQQSLSAKNGGGVSCRHQPCAAI